MDIQLFQANRARFPSDELRAHNGRWIAFNHDATRIVASAETLDELEGELAAAGVNAEYVGLEWVENLDEIAIGGAELL
ncbi:MAG: hypothetical protein KY476_01430 [Planctomycetes bacterium]|nr:hypothetical protein [Planctomycetota bacterium]